MTQPTDDPKTWFDQSTRDGQEKTGAAYAQLGWTPKHEPGESHDQHQNFLAGFNSKR